VTPTEYVPRVVSTAREILRHQQTVDDGDGDAWFECLGSAPAFAFDLVKPGGVSLALDHRDMIIESRKWRAARDCMRFECRNCDTVVTMSQKAWQSNGREITIGKECPSSETWHGMLEYEIPNYCESMSG